jgi:2-keto-4-pentenoate hydratase/2-oxohepta-3-ene-1,7-dioic acid hydratase in catechol pathway
MVRVGEWDDDGIAYGGRTYDPDAVEILAPSDPEKIIVLDKNQAIAVELSGIDPSIPRLYVKTPNAVVGHGGTVTIPAPAEELIVEAELGVVIGRQAKHVPREDAMDYVAGYTCADDLLINDEFEDDPAAIRENNFDNCNPLGPVMVPPESVPDAPDVELRIDGELRREADLSGQIFSVPEIIESVTQYLTLEQGDVLITGSAMEPCTVDGGERVEITVEGVGTLEHYIGQ